MLVRRRGVIMEFNDIIPNIVKGLEITEGTTVILNYFGGYGFK